MIDVESLKARADLLGLIGQDTQLRRVASTNGGEFAGPCPFCGGRDRFRVWPVEGRWWCRQCDRGGDAIAYLMRHGLSFVDACERLGGAPVRTTPIAPAPVTDPEPTAEWRAKACEVALTCVQGLWSDQGKRARAWLNARGLRDGTLLGWDAGYNGTDREIAGLWVPAGIVIPWWVDGEVWHLNVRRAKGDPKYKAVSGGHPCLFGADRLAGYEVVVLTEGEFDAILLRQESHSRVGVGTLGGCKNGLSRRAVLALLHVTTILAAYDSDDEGRRGAERLAALSARIRRLDVPGGHHDLTDAWKAGVDLGAWLEVATC